MDTRSLFVYKLVSMDAIDWDMCCTLVTIPPVVSDLAIKLYFPCIRKKVFLPAVSRTYGN